ncbi:MAG: hypothetical protein EA340_08270 [Nitriliruptor sp.]|nr:MAG: hypothetical protein EA340_08270 [Nitriliruptor sp.]
MPSDATADRAPAVDAEVASWVSASSGRRFRRRMVMRFEVTIPLVTALALVALAWRFRDPARRTPVAAVVEVVSVTLGAALLVELVLAGGGWTEVTATSGLFLLFGATVASALSMGRVIGAVVLTRRCQQVPFDAIVSFGAVSVVAAFLSGVMLLAAAGSAVMVLVATIAVLRAVAHPWQVQPIVQRWSWGPHRVHHPGR